MVLLSFSANFRQKKKVMILQMILLQKITQNGLLVAWDRLSRDPIYVLPAPL